MNLLRHVARLSALATAVVVVWSCDSHTLNAPPVIATDDVERPEIKFSLSAGSNNVVDIGAALSVSVTGTDNRGVGSMFTRINNGAQVVGVDTTTITPIQKSVTRVVPVSLSGAARGDRLVIRTTVADGAANQKTDSVVVMIADTTGPSLIASSSKANGSLAGGGTLDVRITARDSAGIAYAGYRLLRIGSSDSVLVRAESTFVATGVRVSSFQTPVYNWVVPDTLTTGSYAVVPFALDRSGVYTKAGKPGANFNLVDAANPGITFLSPIAGATLNVGDSLLVTAHITDNVALQKVSFVGTSTRTQVVIRYPQVTAPTSTTVFRAGVRDTLIQRYLKVATPIDPGTDTLVVTGVVTDAANNVGTVQVKLKMGP